MFIAVVWLIGISLHSPMWIGDTPVVTTPTPPAPITTPSRPLTPDRLAAPPTRENPTQADEGAQLFWLHCQPCHGDQGQGLTAEWRAQYPEEDRNCWKSGCHGLRPYENGFTLPAFVPAVIGDTTLMRFHNAADLYNFVQKAMPYQAPASLTQMEYWAITAFLLDKRNLGDAFLPLQDKTTARHLILNPGAPPVELSVEAQPASRRWSLWFLGFLLIGAVAIAGIGFRRWVFR